MLTLAPISPTRPIRPFLKWPGCKARLIQDIVAQMPQNGTKRFIEPFVGSGAVCINIQPLIQGKGIIADANPDLISVFNFLKQENGKFIGDCKKLFKPENNDATVFYRLRKEFNETTDLKRKATLFVYLNRHCFNGLCRYNSSGGFNAPFGSYTKPYWPGKEMDEFYKIIKNLKIENKDFRNIMNRGKAGDFIYCDPPYLPLNENASFTAYSTGGFSLRDQRDLATTAEKAASRGATVVISNHDTPLARKLYENADDLKTLLVTRTISCDGATRKQVKELIVTFNAK